MNRITRGSISRWRWRRILVAAALVAGAGFAAVPSQVANADSSICPDANVAAFGPDVCVFTDTMSQAAIQKDLDSIATQQVPNQFGTQRYAIFFESGTYGSAADPLVFTIGYYTSVAGLGLNPGGVVINGAIDSLNQCSGGSCTALDNFWRSVSNLTINVTGGTGCYANAEFWAVSQASPLGRVHINGNVTLFDYCSNPSYSSGGFIADSQFTGMATLVPQRGNAAMIVVPNRGVKLSGLIIDAGPVNSPVLVSVGTPGPSSASDPDLIQDVFFRIGGAETTPVSATVSLLDNAGNSIIDDVWAWRADYGNAVGWTVNTADTGVAVTGNNVTAYGLFTEHYQKNEVIWSGQGGTDIFFQNELPYDPPSQSAWMASPTQDGYPAFLVTPNVKSFQGYGMGSYVVFIQTQATLFNAEAFQSPRTPGVQFHDLLGVWIAGSGGDNSIINGVGGPVTSTNPGTVEPVDLISYP